MVSARTICGGSRSLVCKVRGIFRNHPVFMTQEAKMQSPNGRVRFSQVARWASRVTAHPLAFLTAVGAVLTWAITGPLFGFSDTWQLVINTATTIVTFLMVFLIQNSQNRDSAAIQLKLDELIRVGRARNSLVGIEHLTEEELENIRRKCESRAQKP